MDWTEHDPSTKYPEHFDAACEIVQKVEPDGKMTYQIPSGRKLQLTCEIAEALIQFDQSHYVGHRKE